MKSKYNSSLFNEIGNIELFRVSEETKKKGNPISLWTYRYPWNLIVF